MLEQGVLSERFLQKIQYRLEIKGFKREDFAFNSITQDNGNVLFKIIYKYEENYWFKTEINDGNKFYIEFSPGEILSVESKDSLYTEFYLKALREWVGLIKSEMISNPMGRKINFLQGEIEKFQDAIASHKNFEERYFTKEEGEELKRLLYELKEGCEKNTEEEIEKEFADQQQLNSDLRDLRSEIDSLTEQVDYLKNKKWYLLFASRAVHWTISNPKIVKGLGVWGAKKLLPEDVQSILPSILEENEQDR